MPLSAPTPPPLLPKPYQSTKECLSAYYFSIFESNQADLNFVIFCSGLMYMSAAATLYVGLGVLTDCAQNIFLGFCLFFILVQHFFFFLILITRNFDFDLILTGY